MDGEGALMECFDRVWVNEGFATPQQSLDFYNKGCRMLDNYWQAEKDAKTEIVYVEKDFKFKLGKNTVRGIIDRIDRLYDGGYEVIDYKTHAEMWEKDRIDSDLQLSIYALGCRESLGKLPRELSFYFLAHQKKVSTERTPEQLNDALKLMNDIADKITRREFQPKFESCKNCGLRDGCVKRKQHNKGKTGE
jgi:RecB family exonuclease